MHNSGLFEPLPGLPPTRASMAVWANSARADNQEFIAQHCLLSKTEMVNLYHLVRLWNRRQIEGRYGGQIGQAALSVLQSLAFDFLNYKTGRCDPSYEALALRTGLSRATVARALKRLKEAGILRWCRRCLPAVINGRWCLRQISNSYTIMPASYWLGLRQPRTFAVEPGEWGAAPPLPDTLIQAREDLRAGGSAQAAMAVLRCADKGSMSAALASLFDTINATKQVH